MDKILVDMALFAGFLKTDPVYSFVLDAFPLMIVSTFGSIVAQLNSEDEITKRSTIAGIMSAIALAVMANAVCREYHIKVHLQVLIALVAGLRGEQVLKLMLDKTMAKIKAYNGK